MATTGDAVRRLRRRAPALVAASVAVALGAVGPGGDLSARPVARGAIVRGYRPDDGAAPRWAAAAIRVARSRLGRSAGPGSDLAVRAVDADALGMTHVRFDQRYRGVPVFGGQTIAHLGPGGRLRARTGRLYRGLRVSVTPRLSARAAIRVARDALGHRGRFARVPSARLLVLPGGRGVLAFQVSLWVEDGTPRTAHHEYFVSASSGRVVRHLDGLATDGVELGVGHSLYSGDVELLTRRRDGVFSLADPTRGGLSTVDMRGAFGLRVPGGPILDADNAWGDGTAADPRSAAVDAQFGAAVAWDYLLDVHARRGIDGEGFRIVSRVHYGERYTNAFWNGEVMTYGDGDGIRFRPLTALDVAGHEIAHGLTEHTAGLIYAKEPGAANESFSDIFGAAVEFHSGVGSPDYLVGEDVLVPADEAPGFRNMADPPEDGDPDHYSIRLFPDPCKPSGRNDRCGVHSNSGIQNNAFYLLAEGGTNGTSGIRVTGIGRPDAERIFFRALTVYLFPSARFSDVREACELAAADLFGASSAQAQATTRAWTAVGVA